MPIRVYQNTKELASTARSGNRSIFRTQWVVNVSLVLLSLIVAVGLFEILYRILKPNYNINPFWRYHPVIGWSQVPGAKYDYVFQGKRLRVEFNSQGFRDVEHSLEKPPGTKRIVLVGDSFCEATQVNLEETFFRLLEGKLNESGKNKWEIINLGVGDFGTTQEWVALTELGLAYSPDVVISQVFPLNDLCNNTIELYGLCKSENDRYRPYFVESNGKLRLTSAQPIRNLLRRHSKFYGMIEHKLFLVLKRRLASDAEKFYDQRTQEMGLAPLGPALYAYVRDEEQHPVVAKGWWITEQILQKMASLCRDRSIQFIPVVVPFEACVGPRWKSFSKGFPRQKMIQDYPEKRLGRFFDRLGLAAVLLKETFEQNIDVVLPYSGGHLSPGGHRVAAEGIYAKMVQIGLVRR